MPDLISLPQHVVSRGHPVFFWIPAFAGMTTLGIFIATIIMLHRASVLFEHHFDRSKDLHYITHICVPFSAGSAPAQ